MFYKILFFIFIFILLGIIIYFINKYLSKDSIVRNRNNNNNVQLSKQQLYEKLMKDFNKIFPDRNRNSGGVQFYKYILDNYNPSKYEFDLYNQFYCS